MFITILYPCTNAYLFSCHTDFCLRQFAILRIHQTYLRMWRTGLIRCRFHTRAVRDLMIAISLVTLACEIASSTYTVVS